MLKYKIRVIDSYSPRSASIVAGLYSYNAWPDSQALMSYYHEHSNDGKPYVESDGDNPDLVFAHLSDLMTENLECTVDYIFSCVQRNILIVLYSAGGIARMVLSEAEILLKQESNEWKVPNTAQICVVPHKVSSITDLHLDTAMPFFPNDTECFKRCVCNINLFFEDYHTLLSYLNEGKWRATPDESNLMQSLCTSIGRQTPLASDLWERVRTLRQSKDYQSDVRALTTELYDRFQHLLKQ